MMLLPMQCAMAAVNALQPEEQLSVHWEDLDREALQQLAGPEAGKSVVEPGVVRQVVGKDLDGWILAAQVEHDSFLEKEAVVEATAEDLKAYGKRPLPMLNVWSRTSEDVRKCRSCIAGNFQKFDPAAQRWTAQAEPGSIFAAAKMAAMRGWEVSKLDVKGAFLNAPLPDGELILVEPPKQWKDWGIVGKNVVWRLQRAVYGLRQSPKWWSDKRDSDLRKLKATVAGKGYHLRQNEADSQVWTICEDGSTQILGVICVYVDDFLVMAPKGQVRAGVVEALKSLWQFGAEHTLSPETSVTFLGIEWFMKINGDIVLSQERFVKELLAKHQMTSCNSLKSITIDKPPETEDVPTPEALTELQAFAGSFNWLATRTRPDMAYYVSLLASSASKQSTWSRTLAHKVLRYLAGTAQQGLTMSANGDEDDMRIYADAGFAGVDTKSQNGMIISWGGSIITWRSSRAALSALSTAEAELCSAALGWQVGEGVRYLLSTLSIFPKHLEILIDNKAALTTASLGATWRTRYYAVRAQRLLEEHQAGKIVLTYCPTKLMVADALTKLATAEVIGVLLAAMDSQLPSHTMAHRAAPSPTMT